MRYFLEVSYKGTGYSGFQVQQNANSIQAEVTKATSTLLKEEVVLTGSSRTDAGVHALQNYFHFDTAVNIPGEFGETGFQYKMNAILPAAIAVRNIHLVKGDAHCRFDAISREYRYYITRVKNPFWSDRSYFFPYRVNIELMHKAAELLMSYNDFTSFSKRNTQAKTFLCRLLKSEWQIKGGLLVYKVTGDRFLRGMVRALTGTMLKVGREKMSISEFREVIEMRDCTKANFAVPGHGLFLRSVNYPEAYFDK
jgi:tRNA pseudouridine38-40 synthase